MKSRWASGKVQIGLRNDPNSPITTASTSTTSNFQIPASLYQWDTSQHPLPQTKQRFKIIKENAKPDIFWSDSTASVAMRWPGHRDTFTAVTESWKDLLTNAGCAGATIFHKSQKRNHLQKQTNGRFTHNTDKGTVNRSSWPKGL